MLLNVVEIEKYYGTRNNLKKALDRVSFSVNSGDFVSIMGASGSGKTTLLNCISTIDSVSSGHIYLGEQDLTTISSAKMAAFRRENLGFIFQDFNLLEPLTIEENISLPLSIKGIPGKEIEKIVKRLMQRLNISDIAGKLPAHVSGGQKQRVAIASAIASERPVILFDEPTSGLDLFHMRQVADSVKGLADSGKTIVIVTHDPEFILRCCNYVIHLENGRLEENYFLQDTEGRERLFNFFMMEGGGGNQTV